jgi:hypothetical protein
MKKAAQGNRLNPKLEGVLVRLCQKLGPMTITRAVKIPYLVDVLANHYLGRSITDSTHETWDYGVVTKEVWSYIQSGGDIYGTFDVTEHNFSEGGKQIAFVGEPDEDLNSEEEAVVDLAANIFGHIDAASLGKLTKSLNTHFDARVWGNNHRASVDEDAYARLSESYQAFCGKLPYLDFSNEKDWGDPIVDPREYLRQKLGE